MFRRKDIDDFDDYRKEQAEINREKNHKKSSKSNKKTSANGNPVYFSSKSPESIIAICMVLMIPIIMITMMVNISGADLRNISVEILVPIVFFLLFFVIFFFATNGFSPNANRIELSDNALICKLAFNRKLEIPYSNFIEVECKRMYGKNHQYTGTRYYIIYRDSNSSKECKIAFLSSDNLTISDLNYEVQKKLSNTDIKMESDVITQQFLIPKSKNFNASKMRLVLMYPMISFIVVMFVCGMMVSKSGLTDEGIPFAVILFLFLITFVIVTTLKLNRRKWDKTPESITFEQDGIRVDDTFIRRSEIKKLYITPIGCNNPRALDNSTIDIITEDARYSYNLGLFYYGKRQHYMANEEIIPQWSFDAFYSCAQRWCNANNVDMVDFLI